MLKNSIFTRWKRLTIKCNKYVLKYVFSTRQVYFNAFIIHLTVCLFHLVCTTEGNVKTLYTVKKKITSPSQKFLVTDHI